MSVIVASPKEGVIIADRFILQTSDPYPDVSSMSISYEDKLLVTPDRQFAYVFKSQQDDNWLPVLFNFLTRLELGLLDKKVKALDGLPPEINLVIMTRRGIYEVDGNADKAKVKILTLPWTNMDLPSIFLNSLEIPASLLWETIVSSGEIYANNEQTVVTQASLVLIKKGKKK